MRLADLPGQWQQRGKVFFGAACAFVVERRAGHEATDRHVAQGARQQGAAFFARARQQHDHGLRWRSRLRGRGQAFGMKCGMQGLEALFGVPAQRRYGALGHAGQRTQNVDASGGRAGRQQARQGRAEHGKGVGFGHGASVSGAQATTMRLLPSAFAW